MLEDMGNEEVSSGRSLVAATCIEDFAVDDPAGSGGVSVLNNGMIANCLKLGTFPASNDFI